jgi:hypothetical protein
MTRNEKLLLCVEACKAAMQDAQQCAAVCIKSGWRRKGRMLALVCLDTADACEAAIKALARGSEHHSAFCALCHTVAQHCADQCDNYAAQSCRNGSMEPIRKCAESCRKCADVCRKQAEQKQVLTISARCYLLPRSE